MQAILTIIKAPFRFIAWVLRGILALEFITRFNGRRGLYLNPFTAWFYLPYLGYMIGLMLMGSVWFIRAYNGLAQASDVYVVFIPPLISAIALPVLVFKGEPTEVDTSLMAMLSLLGLRIPVYLVEGNYFLELDNPVLGRVTKPVEPGTDANGFLYEGTFSFPIWDSTEMVNDKPNLKIGLNSRGGPGVFFTATIKLRHQNPGLWYSADDSGFLLGESSRTALRHTAGLLTDLNAGDTQHIIGPLMLGQRYATARLSERCGELKVGSFLADKSGNSILFPVEADFNASEEEIEAAEDAAKERLRDFVKRQKAHRFAHNVIKSISDGDKLRVVIIGIDSTMIKTAQAFGSEIETVLISDFELSETMQQKSDLLSSEALQHNIEERTAQSMANVAATTAETIKTHGRDAAFLAKAATGTPVNNINLNIPGLDEVLKAALSLTGGKETEGKSK